MRLLVCGGRKYADRAAVWGWLDAFHASADGPIDILIHGAANLRLKIGADYFADAWARDRGVEPMPFPAEWARYGNAAGPIRNQQMLDEGHPALVVAFPGGRGTASMVKLALAAGVRVVRVERKE